MKCLNCGKRISKKFNLCPNCGEKIVTKRERPKENNKIIYILIAIIFILIFIISTCLFLLLSNKRVDYDRLKSYVVLINVYDEDNELISTGSGVVAFEDDIIITNAHVIEDNYKIEVLSENNTKYQVTGILDYNKKKDIAILKIKKSKGLSKIKIGKNVKVGDSVIAIGSPLGLKNTVSEGNISGNFQDNIEVYQHTAPISPGSSGGALLDSKGNLIGITYASLTEGQNLNLAIPIEYFKKEYNIVKDNENIETRYYKYLNNSVFKTQNGNKILQYVLNDEFYNIEDNLPLGCIGIKCDELLEDEDEYINGTIKYSTTLLNNNNIKSLVQSYFKIQSGNPGYFVSVNGNPKRVIEPNYYYIEIYHVNDNNLLKAKEEIDEYYSAWDGEGEKYKIINNDKVIGVTLCVNYNECDKVENLLNNYIKD